MLALQKWYPPLAASLVTLTGVGVMLGWLFEIDPVKRVLPGLPTMKFNSALCFVIAGVALGGLHYFPNARRKWRWLGVLLLIVVLATGSQYVLGKSLGIDAIFVTDHETARAHPGRMTALSVVIFTLVGVGLLTLDRPSARAHRLGQTAALIGLILGLLAFMEYVFNLDGLTVVQPLSSIALHTAITFVILTMGLLHLGIERGWTSLLASDTNGGRLLRHFIPAAVVVPFVVGWLEIQARAWQLYPFELENAMFILANTLIFLALAWRLAIIINQADAERAKIGQQLTESEGLYRGLFESIDDAIIVHDMEGQIIEVNAAAAQRLGYSQAELLRLKTTDLDSPAYGANFANRLERQQQEGFLQDITGTHISKDGREIPIHVNTRFMTFRGQPAIFALVRDVSLLRHHEQQAIDLVLERERSRILAQFMQDASHEFRTPLAIMNMNLYLYEQMQDPSKREAAFGKIKKQVGDLTRLVDELVLTMQLESGTTPHFELADIGGLVQKVVASFGPQQSRLKFEYQAVGQVLADPPKLERAVGHIVENALRYSPAEQTVCVRVLREQEGVVVTIQDSGVGIAPDDLTRIFERFYRADVAHTTPGFGLGLAIAKRIVEAHSGRIDVTSVVGQGSTFRVWLPIA